ncbi:porin family protein [Vibrio sp.]|nr:porin family protein [Vibrio sp.]
MIKLKRLSFSCLLSAVGYISMTGIAIADTDIAETNTADTNIAETNRVESSSSKGHSSQSKSHVMSLDRLSLGGGIGYSMANDDSYSGSEPDSLSVGVLLHYEIQPDWGVEVGYQDYGEYDANNTGVDISTSALLFSVVYKHVIASDWALTGQVGGAYYEMEKTAPNINQQSVDDGTIFFAVGVERKLMDPWSIEAEYQYIDAIGDDASGQYDANTVNINLLYAL